MQEIHLQGSKVREVSFMRLLFLKISASLKEKCMVIYLVVTEVCTVWNHLYWRDLLFLSKLNQLEFVFYLFLSSNVILIFGR